MRVNSLTTRYLLALLLTTALPFLAFGWYVRGEMRAREEQQVVSVYLPEWATNTAKKIAANLEHARRAGGYLAEAAAQALEEKQDLESFEEFEEMVGSIYNVNSDFDMVILANEEGKVLSVVRNPGLDAATHDELVDLQPETVDQYEWFKAIQKGSPVECVDRHLSPFLHRNPARQSKDPTDYSLGLAFAVQMPTGSYGPLYILLRWKQVQDVLDETWRFLRDEAGFASAQVLLCNASGEVLGHTNRDAYGKKVKPASFRQAVLEKRSGEASFETESGEPSGAGFAELPKQIVRFDWKIVLHAPHSQLFKVSRSFGQRLLFVIPLIVLVLSLVALLASGAIIRPVRRLSEATRRISQGDLSTRVVAHGGDELADLGRSFNTMAEDLAENRERLRDAERQAAWAEMARQVAHEIKNPLTPMRMSAQLLLKAKRENDPRWESLTDRLARNVIQQTDALDRIASDFRQFAGAPARDVATLGVDELLAGVEELVSSMSEVSGIELKFAPGAAGAEIKADRQEMRRVFLNLIQNAVQACEGGGQVEISSTVSDGHVQYRVRDGGPGIPEELRPKLFEPYFTSKTSGTGLGLAICRKIVEAHGGQITLESSRPGHTVFLLTLPQLSPKQQPGTMEPGI